LLEEYELGEMKLGRRRDPSKHLFTTDDDAFIWEESEKNRVMRGGIEIPGKSRADIAEILSTKHGTEITREEIVTNRIITL
jgi:hypothetical protein